MSASERADLSDSGDGALGQLDGAAMLAAVRYWWRLAVPTAFVLAVAAAAVVVYVSKPQYTAASWLIIREKPEYLLNPQVMDDPRKFVQNQLELMRSPPVVDPVANQPDVFATPELAQELIARLARSGVSGYALGMGPVHVYAGAFEAAGDAEILNRQLRDRGFESALVRRRGVETR